LEAPGEIMIAVEKSILGIAGFMMMLLMMMMALHHSGGLGSACS
jgi:hypothetical protein